MMQRRTSELLFAFAIANLAVILPLALMLIVCVIGATSGYASLPNDVIYLNFNAPASGKIKLAAAVETTQSPCPEADQVHRSWLESSERSGANDVIRIDIGPAPLDDSTLIKLSPPQADRWRVIVAPGRPETEAPASPSKI